MIGNVIGAKPLFYSLHHEVSNQASIDPIGCGHPALHFTIAAIYGKGGPDSFTVIA
jgi:hypothetical protein